jgi:hypothetical protein
VQHQTKRRVVGGALAAGLVTLATMAWSARGWMPARPPAPDPSPRHEPPPWITGSPYSYPVMGAGSPHTDPGMPSASTGAPGFRPDFLLYRPMDLNVDPPTIPAGQADGQVAEDELVLGIELDGEARAYPVNQLSGPENEVVNDIVAGRPIVLAWCDLCAGSFAFAGTVGDQTLRFRPAGLWRRVSIMADDETGSLWSQMLGQAMSGPLEGQVLEPIPVVYTDWAAWRSAHPKTSVLAKARATDRYTRDLPDDASDHWIGTVRGAHARAWSFAALRERPLVHDEFDGLPLLVAFDRASDTPRLFDRRVDGRVLTFHLDGSRLVDDATASAWDPRTGRATGGPLEGARLEPLPTIVANGTAWKAYYPDFEGRGSEPTASASGSHAAN